MKKGHFDKQKTVTEFVEVAATLISQSATKSEQKVMETIAKPDETDIIMVFKLALRITYS